MARKVYVICDGPKDGDTSEADDLLKYIQSSGLLDDYPGRVIIVEQAWRPGFILHTFDNKASAMAWFDNYRKFRAREFARSARKSKLEVKKHLEAAQRKKINEKYGIRGQL